LFEVGTEKEMFEAYMRFGQEIVVAAVQTVAVVAAELVFAAAAAVAVAVVNVIVVVVVVVVVVVAVAAAAAAVAVKDNFAAVELVGDEADAALS
jgi:hypothetical protein